MQIALAIRVREATTVSVRFTIFNTLGNVPVDPPFVRATSFTLRKLVVEERLAAVIEVLKQPHFLIFYHILGGGSIILAGLITSYPISIVLVTRPTIYFTIGRTGASNPSHTGRFPPVKVFVAAILFRAEDESSRIIDHVKWFVSITQAPLVGTFPIRVPQLPEKDLKHVRGENEIVKNP